MGELVLAALLIGVAGFRVWRLAARDQITEPLRAPIIQRSDRRGWAWVLDWLTCPWCSGAWITGGITVICGQVYGWLPMEAGLVWLASSAVCGFLGREDDK